MASMTTNSYGLINDIEHSNNQFSAYLADSSKSQDPSHLEALAVQILTEQLPKAQEELQAASDTEGLASLNKAVETLQGNRADLVLRTTAASSSSLPSTNTTHTRKPRRTRRKPRPSSIYTYRKIQAEAKLTEGQIKEQTAQIQAVEKIIEGLKTSTLDKRALNQIHSDFTEQINAIITKISTLIEEHPSYSEHLNAVIDKAQQAQTKLNRITRNEPKPPSRLAVKEIGDFAPMSESGNRATIEMHDFSNPILNIDEEEEITRSTNNQVIKMQDTLYEKASDLCDLGFDYESTTRLVRAIIRGWIKGDAALMDLLKKTSLPLLDGNLSINEEISEREYTAYLAKMPEDTYEFMFNLIESVIKRDAETEDMSEIKFKTAIAQSLQLFAHIIFEM